jgi:hypothetical protein
MTVARFSYALKIRTSELLVLSGWSIPSVKPQRSRPRLARPILRVSKDHFRFHHRKISFRQALQDQSS